MLHLLPVLLFAVSFGNDDCNYNSIVYSFGGVTHGFPTGIINSCNITL